MEKIPIVLKTYWERLIALFGIFATVLAFLLPDWHGLLYGTIGSCVVLCASYSFRRWNSRWERRGRVFFHNLCRPSYLEWQQATLESLYGASMEIASVYGRKYPAAIIKPSIDWQYPFTNLCSLTDVTMPHLIADKEQTNYIRMLGLSLKWPRMKGFAVHRIECDASGRAGKIEVRATNFYQNVITCHILEWELYSRYRKLKTNRNQRSIPLASLHDLPRRDKYHNGRPADLALLEPVSAYPLVSVQAMVVFRDCRSVTVPVWRVVLAKRSEDVIVKPGYYQFQPAGGFEIYGTEASEEVNAFLLRQGCNVMMALFREYAEELFDAKHLQVRPDSRDPSSVLSDPNVIKLSDLIARDKAHIDYLGISIDLSLLRHELSFLIVIEDDEWSKSPLLGSWEAKNIFVPCVSELRDVLAGGILHGSSAALLKLAIGNERLRSLGISADLEGVQRH